MDHTNVDMAEKMNYRCSGPKQWHGKNLLDFDKTKITCLIVKYNVAQSMGSAAAGIVFTSCLGILIYGFRWRIRLRAYLFSKRGKMFLRHSRTTNQQRNYGAIRDGEMQFDAYISCSEHDNPWVLHHLLPGIDNGQLNDDTPFGGEFRLYYDERDSEAGES